MHWCPDCGEPCYCDMSDMDWGEKYCNFHICRKIDEFENHDEDYELTLED